MVPEITIKIQLTPDANVTVKQEGTNDQYDIPPLPDATAEEHAQGPVEQEETGEFGQVIPSIPDE